MDLNNPTDFFKRGFYVTLGATTALVEALQDEKKREENLAQLNLGMDELTQVWAQKGEEIESEARHLVDNLVSQYSPPTRSSSSSAPAPSPVTLSLQQQLQEFTTQLAAIRTEIQQLSDSSNP
jgi:hypothetical protein